MTHKMKKEDKVEVIRCKDCEWMLYESERWKEYPEQEWCDYYECETNLNGFCYRAEKRGLSLKKTSDKNKR